MQHHRDRLHYLSSKRRTKVTLEPPIDPYRSLFEDNPKRNYFMENKVTEIERENRMLFEKIARISRNRRSDSFGETSKEKLRSLNRVLRKKQGEVIEVENARMFNRIREQKASISFKEADKEFTRTRRLSNQLSQIEKFKVESWY